MSVRPPERYESWEAVDADFDQFVADMPLRRAQLRERIAATRGPELDGSLESLRPLNVWYIRTALSGEPDGWDWWPLWLERSAPPTNPMPHVFGNPVPDDVIRLWELVAVYVGDVMLPLMPPSRWVCFRARQFREVINGQPMIDRGDRTFPANPITIANAGVPRAVSHRGTGSRFDKPADPTELVTHVATTVQGFEAARQAGTLKWQKAPTGPDAHRRTTKPDW